MAGRILICDGIAINRIVLRVKLSGACYDVGQAATLDEMRRQAAAQRPDLLLIDLDGDPEGALELCREASGRSGYSGATASAPPGASAAFLRPGTPGQVSRTRPPLVAAGEGIPVLFLSRQRDTGLRGAALQAGACDVLSRPVSDDLLLARIRRLLRERGQAEEHAARDLTSRNLGLAEDAAEFAPAPGRVALIARNAATGHAWAMALGAVSGERFEVTSRDAALAGAAAGAGESPDAFVIAADLLPRGEALRLLSELRSRSETRHAAILMVMDPAAPVAAVPGPGADPAAMALDLGANDILREGFSAEELALRLAAQLMAKRRADQLRRSVRAGLEMAVRDPLTGLYNRRYAVPHLHRMALRADASGAPFAVMVLDLDRFKLVNDTWGHAAGDAVLIEVAARLRNNLRSEDLVARIGGEEFLVAMPETGFEAAHVAAQRIRRVVRDTPVPLPAGAPPLRITVSIGVAIGGLQTAEPDGPDMLLHQADLALYGAKADGRDQITLARPAA